MAVSRKLILEDWQKANDALNLRFEGNKSKLSEKKKISRTLLTDFFAQKPIGESSFRKICLALVLNWEEIAQIVSRSDNDAGKSIEDLVQKTRIQHQPTIKRQCGTIFLLGARKSVEIGRLFVRVNILERLTGEQRWGMERLLGYFNEKSDAFNRFGLSNPVEIISGDDAAQEFDRLMVLGKPGAGKTTFLKHVAIACMFDDLLSEFIPVFLSLKKFADDLQENAELTLLDTLQESFSGCDLSLDNLKALLKAGRMIVLLDGLDEAGDSQETVDKLVRRFMDEFHQNRFVIGCRIAAYSRYFEGFTDVEVADFDRQQVHEFVEKWFAAVVRTRDPMQQASKEWAKKFMIGLDANPQIRDLMVTPLLLNLACVVFRDNERFPTQPYELYEESLTTLMSGWDSEREVKRDSRYKSLQTGQRLRLLSQLGAVTFAEEAYFFKQERVEELIEGFLRSLPDGHVLEIPLVGRDEGILKAIESHHGLLVERARRIYSFSHLTFQEYFTARHLIASREGLEELVSHAGDPRWQEVLLLAVALLKDGHFLIRSVKQSIDQLIAEDIDLQLFLEWVERQSNYYLRNSKHKPAAIRSFYFLAGLNGTFDRALEQTQAHDLVPDFDLNRALDITLDINLAFDLAITFDIDLDFNFDLNSLFDLDRIAALNLIRGFVPTPTPKLFQMRAQLMTASTEDDFLEWWQMNGLIWRNELRQAIIEYRNTGHKWQFTKDHQKKLHRYFNSNKQLFELLKIENSVPLETREEIENDLLLPISELKSRLSG